MTFNEWLIESSDIYARAMSSLQRYGQFVFNHLYSVRPDIANKLRGTEYDPFYNDSRVTAFFDYVEKEWDR